MCIRDSCNVSANVAYGQVKLESSAPEVYEELDTLTGGGVNKLSYVASPQDQSTPSHSQPATPVYDIADESASKQQPLPPEDEGHYDNDL